MSFVVKGIGALVSKFSKLSEALAMAGTHKISVTSNAEYTEFVIHGTRPHMIFPRNAQALSNNEDFGPVASVRHPGTKPDDFPKRAAAKVRPLLIREYTAMIGEGLYFGFARAEAAKIKVSAVLLAATREEAPHKTGELARGLHLVGQIGDIL